MFSSPLTDHVDEAKRIIAMAEAEEIILRVLGGVAVRIHCHGPHTRHVRPYHDIDFFGLKKQYKGIERLFRKAGIHPQHTV